LNDLWDRPKALAAADIIAHGYHHHNVESTPATPLQPMLRGIVNQSHSNGKSQSNSDRNMIRETRNGTSDDKAIRNTKDYMLRDTNRYVVLENYDDVEHAETSTKSTT